MVHNNREVVVGERGRLVLPAAVRAELGLKPGTRLLLSTEADGTLRVGRVVTRADHRSDGLARRLVEAVLAEHDDVRADAQSHLRAWYEALGFDVVGDEYLEDGIPHLPMRRTVSGG